MNIDALVDATIGGAVAWTPAVGGGCHRAKDSRGCTLSFGRGSGVLAISGAGVEDAVELSAEAVLDLSAAIMENHTRFRGEPLARRVPNIALATRAGALHWRPVCRDGMTECWETSIAGVEVTLGLSARCDGAALLSLGGHELLRRLEVDARNGGAVSVLLDAVRG